MLIWKEWWVGWCPCQFPSIHCPTGNLIAATEASLIFIIIIVFIYNSLCVCWFSNLAPRFLLNLTPNIWKLHILGKLGCTANPTSTGCISENFLFNLFFALFIFQSPCWQNWCKKLPNFSTLYVTFLQKIMLINPCKFQKFAFKGKKMR